MDALSRAVVVVCVLATAAAAHAQLTYVESVHGELSDNRSAPTQLALGLGLNTITGTFGPSPIPDVHDMDFVTITIPAGRRLDRLELLAADVGGSVAFIGLQAGGFIGENPTQMLGWTHYANTNVGANLLPAIGAAAGTIGFTPPLSAGTYTLWIQEIDGARVYSYSFGLRVSPVPACNSADIVSIGQLAPQDGMLTADDFLAFFGAYFGGNPLADIVSIGGLPPSDGVVSADDFLAFFAFYFGGC